MEVRKRYKRWRMHLICTMTSEFPRLHVIRTTLITNRHRQSPARLIVGSSADLSNTEELDASDVVPIKLVWHARNPVVDK
jgi:hypothetical protein